MSEEGEIERAGGDSKVPFPFWRMDTELAKKYSDSVLLMLIANSQAFNSAGYGLIAELCKRYAKEMSITKDRIMSASMCNPYEENK